MSAGPRLVVLCAGASSRLGQPKALVELGPEPGMPVLTRLLAAGRALGDARPLVVSGAEHERVLALLASPVECVQNHAWRAGRTGSIQRAVEARPDSDLCLAPVDVPRVSAAVFAALAAAWRDAGAPPDGWLAPRVATPDGPRHGHPVLVGRGLLARLKDFPPDRPLSVLRALATPLLAVDVEDPGVLEDLDTPADLAQLRTPGTPPRPPRNVSEDP